MLKPAAAGQLSHDDIVYPEALPFVAVHLACLGIFITGVTRADLLICAALYLVRMFAVTAGYHRYFSHRSYRTSRWFQFVLAFLCQTSGQKGVLWWAAKHREHHRDSDTESDIHSPARSGFLFAHVGWIFSAGKGTADYRLVPDLTRYPELVWLDRHQNLPAVALAVAVGLAAGWSGLVTGFFVSTVLLYHGTFAINSLAHLVGRQRYLTGDDSRNNWLLALITLGEGWHNNHHHYQASTRQGFRWWEIDVTFYLLKLLSLIGLVSDLRSPPPEAVRGERKAPGPVIERVAGELAASFRPQPGGGEQASRLPSLEELRQRARAMFPPSPSLDEIARRAHRLLEDALPVRRQATAPLVNGGPRCE